MERTAQMMKGIIFIACFLFVTIILTAPAVHAVDYTYDELNRLVAVSYENGQTIEYEYDAGGNILNVQSDNSEDKDGDGLPDTWEQQIIDADPSDGIETIEDVLPEDDYDGDGYTNQTEYENETDPTVANTSLDIGLVAYYPFNDNADDESGNGHDGVIHGDPEFVDGISGKGMRFDGDGDYIHVDLIESLKFNPNFDSFTVVAWAKPIRANDTDEPSESCNMAYVPFVDSYTYYLNNRSMVGKRDYDHQNGAVSETPFWENENWHLFVGTWKVDGSVITGSYYVDGNLEAQEDLQSIPDGAYPWYGLYIGATRHCSSSLSFGEFYGDEIRIYDRALSESEIQELYEQEPILEGELVGHWKFDEADGNTAIDSSGNGNNGIIYGAAHTTGKFGGALDFNGGPYYALPASTTQGNSYWDLSLFDFSVSISGSQATFKVRKQDGGNFTSTGTIYLKADTYEAGGSHIVQSSVLANVTSEAVLTMNLDEHDADSYPEKFFIRYENIEGAWAWAGPITIYNDGKIRVALPGNMDDYVSDQFTVMMWAKVTNVKGINYLFHAHDDRPGINLRGDNNVYFGARPNGDSEPLPGEPVSLHSQEPLPVGKWAHVACTWDGSPTTPGVYKAYVCGELVGQVELPFFLLGDRIYIAQADGGGERSFDGLIDDVRIYNYALSESEIQEIGADCLSAQEHLLTVRAAGTGKGIITIPETGSILSCTTTCSESYEEGTVVTLVAEPEHSSVFKGWSGAECSGTDDCQVTMDAAKTVTATFAKTYTVATTTTSGHGTISPSGKQTVTHGTHQVFRIIPDSGYRISDVLIDGESVGAFSYYTFRDVSENHRIEAIFVPEFECTAPPTIQSAKSGRWNDPNTWALGRIPNSSDVVLIQDGHIISVLYSRIYVSGLCNHGELRSYPGRMLYVRANTFIDNYGQIRGLDGRSGQTGSSVILYVRNGRVNNHSGATILAGDGGSSGWRRWSWRDRWTRRNDGGRGGAVSVISSYLYNRGLIRSGNGGNSRSGCPGNGGNLSIGARNVSSSSGTLIAGRRGWGNSWMCERRWSRFRFDPNIISLSGAGTKVGGEDVVIFGGKDFVLDLSNMDADSISADANITLAVGEGGIIDLTGSAGTILRTSGEVTILSDKIMLDEGTALEDVIEAANIVTGPAQILCDVSVSGPAQVMGEPGATVSITLPIANGGPEADTCTLSLSDSAGWNIGELAEAITLEAFELSSLTLEVTLPSTIGDTDVVTLTATSQTDPDTTATVDVSIVAGEADEERESDENVMFDDFSDITEDYDTEDKDEDGMMDGWEEHHGLNSALDDASEDLDDDGLSNMEEFQNGTDPAAADTDEDGIPDAWELTHGLNPLGDDASEDPDEDTFSNLEEYWQDTDPRIADVLDATPGIFIVGNTGIIRTDWLYDGGGYQGELGFFSLEGMNLSVPDLRAFIAEAVRRVLSPDTTEGFIVLSDRTEAARFDGSLGEPKDWNFGTYAGARTFAMNPGDRFATILVPDSTFDDLVNAPGTTDKHRRPLFSIVSANGDYGMYAGQVAGVTDRGLAIVYEDMDMSGSDKDYNDLILQITGARFQVPTMHELVGKSSDARRSSRDGWKDWTTSTELGRQIIAHIEALPTEDDAWMTVATDSPAALSVYDAEGRVIGSDGLDMPGSVTEFTEDGGQTLSLPAQSAYDGDYRVMLRSAESGTTALTVTAHEGGAEVSSETSTVEIAPHQTLRADLSASPSDEGLAVTLGEAEAPLCPHDFNGDDEIGDDDIDKIADLWNTCQGDEGFDPFYDLDDDGCITVPDIMRVTQCE